MIKCRLCGREFDDNDISEEHYPAHSVGNDDIVAFDIVKFIDMLSNDHFRKEIDIRMKAGEGFRSIADDVFDNRLSKPLYPHGRTARTLCRECNTFLGKYDESYLKFFNASGDPKIVKGFQKKTKLNIIKAIYAKFLSVPETQNESFDFLDFIKNEDCDSYNGKWKIYFVQRDFSSDIMGFMDIRTGKLKYDEGVVYELSDERFIFDLLDFSIHNQYRMTEMFEILSRDYSITVGTGEDGGYHAQILLASLLSQMHSEN